MYYCCKCKKPLVWQNDFDAEDVLDSNTEGIVSYYACSDCNVLVTVLLYREEVEIILDIKVFDN